MTIGVYQIRNTITDTCYIGASRNTENRWQSHLSELRRGKHINSRLQRDWTTYGETAFEFTLIERLDSHEALPDREHHHMQQRLLNSGASGLYSKIAHAGESLLSHAPPPGQRQESVTVRLAEADIEAWKYITKRRYPADTLRMSQVIRELIREEYARLTAKETTGK